ncbi:hypothetical protein, partial [Klebsiella aerogenes]|uniref:hypothetical protein n=1 Tax=Klebsiella aerogenes TaxID=548 RepID=UPI0021BA9F30
IIPLVIMHIKVILLTDPLLKKISEFVLCSKMNFGFISISSLFCEALSGKSYSANCVTETR